MIFLMVFTGLILYFLPTMLAYGRKTHNAREIAAINIFLGWTILGWIASFVVALLTKVEKENEHQNIYSKLKEKDLMKHESNLIENLQKIIDLHKNGDLSDEEFTQAKRKLIA